MTDINAGTLPSRFYALDGIRGVAAIAVMFYHYTQHNQLDWLHGAWVAVDIFFILSGFVLMHSYSKKVSQGMTFKEFFYSRIARLGPMYIVGLALGIGAALLLIFSNPESPVRLINVATASTLNFFLLPYFNEYAWPFGSHNIHGTVFPLNDPSWSLFFEIFVNIIFFVYLAYCRRINLLIFVVMSGIIFIVLTLGFHQINPGARGSSFVFGFPRVIFEFFFGVLIYQCYSYYKLPPKIFTYGIFFLVALCFFSSKGAIALVNALVLAPVLIAIFAKLPVSGNSVGACKFLGDISYPLYVTHYPIYRLLAEMSFMRELSPLIQTLLFSAIAIVAAVILIKIDESIRSSFKQAKLLREHNS
ncbi:acyltransferase [Cellvibrio zantedeschiae]|uniref:Acyltransferase n=1 Tax=Cellvibrio zantedeschiae TaxID=1237077 RepID=A0ABQ3AVY0_9GAMM|nr:acyltransferase [Cellvibrio zantedeschiae]GGY69532.1 acyltransferase [Cellvibrio zantedeschiae]